jgi:hypothetical protein
MKADRAVITAGNALLANKYLPSSLAVLILPLMLLCFPAPQSGLLFSRP